MKTGSAPVKSNKTLVGSVTFPEYETVAEAQTALGDAKLLELLNSQVKTNAMNQKRQEATGKPTKAQFMSKAMASLTMEELQSCIGDEAKMQALVANKAAQIEADFEKKQNEDLAKVAAENADDADEDTK
jgi:hypothetical protein